MTGQDAVNVATMFEEKIGIDGVILTKLDGDTRGGAALSIKATCGKPILYAAWEKSFPISSSLSGSYGLPDPWDGRCTFSD